MKLKAREMEQELRMWWRLSSEAERLIARGRYGSALVEVLDEMEALAQYSEWPALVNKTTAFLRAHSRYRALPEPVCVS